MRVSTKGGTPCGSCWMSPCTRRGSGRLRDAAERQGISDKYLEQIVTQLARAGLVRSVRGAGGGYLLTRDMKDYTVGDILRPLEGSLAPVECAGSGCGRLDRCVTAEVWQQIAKAVDGVVDNITLADLVARHGEKFRP